MKQPTPTTQVTAYVATDGSLYLDEAECLDKNVELQSANLLNHLDKYMGYSRTLDSEEILEYIRLNFDEIKSILEGNVIEGAVDSKGK
jgi:hypothetical protein